ncbi:MAG: type II methionyl aminopeptidase [Candidatus Micrarchaeia archaeon]
MEGDEEGEEALKNFEEAGKILEEALKYAKKIIKEGEKKLEIAKRVEEFIKEKNKDAKPAFPLNLNTNYIAAHSTPEYNEEKIIGKELINVDFGVEINGYPTDASFTIDLTNENQKLIEASELALKNAISKVKANVEVKEISKEIEETIKKFGLKPIRNLTGHGLQKGIVHAPPEIPNVYEEKNKQKLEEGMVIAIEPFATDGIGLVKESSKVEIFSYVQDTSFRFRDSQEVLKYIKENFSTFPFAERWINILSRFRVLASLVDLTRNGALQEYPELEEVSGKNIAHSEATLIVEKDSARVLTQIF